ncbi:MAG TPA: CPBP family glutamic-type intramembrane protease [Candidatus Acidoferrum sp.]
MPTSRQLGLYSTLGLWAGLVAVFVPFAIFAAHGHGLGERPFVTTLIAFCLFLAMMLVFASRDFTERVSAFAGIGSGWFLGVALFFIFLIYALGTGSASLFRLAAVAAVLFVPLLLLSTAQTSPPGAWQDFFILATVWILIKFGPTHWLWPYPGGQLAYIFTVIFAVNFAIAGFLLLRRTNNVGYSIGWGNNWTLYVLGALVAFACIVIPLAIKIHFMIYAPPHWNSWSVWKSVIPTSIGILFFTAWPEELLFRGLLQNFLSRACNNETIGWISASILFGFSHISNNHHFPNWRYVFLASIAGLFYGWTWRKTGSIFASALVHASVDILWRFFFRAF